MSCLPPDWNLIDGYILAFSDCKAILAFAYSACALGDLWVSEAKLYRLPNATGPAVPTLSRLGEVISGLTLGERFPAELSYY